jgi:hypothetical protein
MKNQRHQNDMILILIASLACAVKRKTKLPEH